MANTLTNSESERLNKVLQGWSSWPCSGVTRPQIIKGLSGGLSNASYLIEHNKARYILRLNRTHSGILGAKRDREKSILEALASFARSPNLIYHDHKYDAFILSYFEGRSCKANELESSEWMVELEGLINQYQTSLNSNAGILSDDMTINYTEHLSRYWQHINDDIFKAEHAESWAEFVVALTEYEKTNTKRALCHHDLNPDNIIITPDGPCIIDWEYAAIGFEEFDKQFLRWQRDKTTSDTAHTPRTKLTAATDQTLLNCLFSWLELLWLKLSQQHNA